MSYSNQHPRIRLFGAPIDAASMDTAVAFVATAMHDVRCRYVCAVSVHGLVESQSNPELRRAYENAAWNLPDGMPLAWLGRALGVSSMQRVTGPDMMLEIFSRPELSSVRHLFYGGREGVAQDLYERFAARFPTVSAVGAVTPPFHKLTVTEEDDFIRIVQASNPHIIWIGLGCPKQELFMARMAERMPACLMFGVGAAFDFHTGRLRDCAPIIKRLGLQWLHRLAQDPRRLWRRYMRVNATFLWMLLTAFFRRGDVSIKCSAIQQPSFGACESGRDHEVSTRQCGDNTLTAS